MAVNSGRGATGVVEVAVTASSSVTVEVAVAVIAPLSVITAIHVSIVSAVHIPVVAWTFDASVVTLALDTPVIPMTTCHTC